MDRRAETSNCCTVKYDNIQVLMSVIVMYNGNDLISATSGPHILSPAKMSM